MVDFAKALQDAEADKLPVRPVHVPKLVWLDLETTGLDPEKGVILEIGVIVTDLALNELGRKSWVLPHVRKDTLTMMDDYVLKMHLKSGLLKEVWKDNSLNDPGRDGARRIIYGDVANWIRNTCQHTRVKLCYLSGSSVGTFDMAWLRKHAPAISDTVSYRVGDVSTFKVFFPGLLTQPEEGPAHRAIADLEYSINQLAQMRDRLDTVKDNDE